jgi:hypothetical protein
VLVILDSLDAVEDTAADNDDIDDGRDDRDSDWDQRRWDPRIDWDSLLDAALAELGLQPPGMPDWFWYRTGAP